MTPVTIAQEAVTQSKSMSTPATQTVCIEILHLKDDSAYYALTGLEVKMPKMGDPMFVSSYETSAGRQGKTFGDSIAHFEKRGDAEALQDVRKQAGSNQDRAENPSFHADSRQAYNYLVIKHVEWYEELAQRSFPANSEQLLCDIAAVLQQKYKSESSDVERYEGNWRKIKVGVSGEKRNGCCDSTCTS